MCVSVTLKRHFLSVHEGLRCKCEQCDKEYKQILTYFNFEQKSLSYQFWTNIIFYPNFAHYHQINWHDILVQSSLLSIKTLLNYSLLMLLLFLISGNSYQQGRILHSFWFINVAISYHDIVYHQCYMMVTIYWKLEQPNPWTSTMPQRQPLMSNYLGEKNSQELDYGLGKM